MSIKYHINPQRGPLICSASSPERCKYGVDAKHFESTEEALAVWEEELSETYGSFNVSSKVVTPSNPKVKQEFFSSFEGMDFHKIQSFANSSKENFKILGEVIDERVEGAKQLSINIAEINPYSDSSTRKCDRETYSSIMRSFNDYKDRTAELVDAHTESKFYKSLVEDADPDFINNAEKVASLVPNTQEWLDNRANYVGGSDVGILAIHDFMKNDEKPFYADSALKNIESSKQGNGATSIIGLHGDYTRQGPAYRGTVWEPRIRDSYAEDHPEFRVLNVKGQYKNKNREWQQVNFDGILIKDGETEPSGVLEIKTASDGKSWDNGIPVSYRAQTLYYLNATGLKFADVRVVINDHETRDFRINAHEEIVPGSGIDMETYINKRVKPWFDEMKSKRKAND